MQSLQGMIDFKDYDGKAALHYAVDDVEERSSVVDSLLRAKALVNIEDADGNHPLHIACCRRARAIVKSLIKNNASTAAKNHCNLAHGAALRR